MASIYCHAIQIETDDGTGRRVSATDTGLGLSSGVFRLITGRPSIGSVSGDTTSMRGPSNTTWYSGRLSADGLTCSRSCDIIETGGLSQVSGFSFGIINTSAFFDAIADLGIKLSRCRVTYWYVTSADASAFAFTQRWQGVVDDNPFSELTMKVQCVDNLKSLLSRSVPAFPVDETSFPLAFPDAKGKMIPVAIGRVAYSPTVNVSGSGSKVEINFDNTTEFYVTAATSYTAGTLTLILITRNRQFATNDSRIVGKSVHVIAGGVDQSRAIVSNTASTFNATISMYVTSVVLDEALDVSTAFVAWTAAGTGQNVWYFEVVKYTASYIASQKPIYDFIDNPKGTPYLMTFVTDDKVFQDFSEILSEFSLTNLAALGFPGLAAIVSSLDGGAISVYFPIYPDDIKVVSKTSITGGDFPAVAASCPLLVDKLDSTYYTVLAAASTSPTLVLDVYFSAAQINKSWDDIYILFDISHKYDTLLTAIFMQISAVGKDNMARVTSTVVAAYAIINTTLSTSYVDMLSLPAVYFPAGGGSDSTFQTHKASLSLVSLVDDIKKSIAYNVLRATVTATVNDGYTLRFKEMGFVAKRTVSITTEDIYTSLIGEMFGSVWYGSAARKTAANPILLIGDAAEHLLRNYAYQYPVWQAGKAYVAGEIVRPTSANDNAHFYIVTTAGTSHASTEPTWPTTTEATVADGTVTWTELGTFKIDTAAFDAVAGYRALWNIGRTLTESQSVEEVLKELADHSFLGIMTDAQGRISPRSWLDDTTPTVTFSESNILAGTLGEMSDSPMRRVYNDFTVKYDYSPGTQKFNKQMTVTKADQPAFPAETDLLGDTHASLGTFTVTRFSFPFGSGYIFRFVTSGAHGLATGDIVSLSGNTVSPLSFDFSARPVSVVDTTTFYVLGHETSSASSTAGTLTENTVSTVKWKTYVSGIDSYVDAKELWEMCRTSYLDTKTISKLPDALGECKWFPDPYAPIPMATPCFQTWLGLVICTRQCYTSDSWSPGQRGRRR